LKSFDEFLERRFPESRRKAYYLMSIHEQLPPQVRKELKQVGWTKELELAKLVRSKGKAFDCAIWLHKARVMKTEKFKREVEKELAGRETEPWEIIYFKLYKSRIPVIEQALETATLMLGSEGNKDVAVNGCRHRPRISRTHRLIPFLPELIPGFPIPRYLVNGLSVLTGRTRIPFSSLSNSNLSPGRTPSTRRTSRGTVIWPLLVILACFCNGHLPSSLLHHRPPYPWNNART